MNSCRITASSKGGKYEIYTTNRLALTLVQDFVTVELSHNLFHTTASFFHKVTKLSKAQILC